MARIRKKRTKVKQRRFNGWRRLFAVSFLSLALLVLLTVSQAGLAHASTGGGSGSCPGCSIVVTSSHLIARTTLLVSGTVTCALPAGSTFQDGSASVEITQASGRQITRGFGASTLTTCNGAAQTFQVAVTPQSTPFHGGPAIATAFFFVDYIDPLGNFAQALVSTDPQVIHITG